METLEKAAPVVEKVTPSVESPNVLDRLAEKSALKIQETQKVQAERKAASITTEQVSTLGKALEITSEEPKKPAADVVAAEKAKVDLIENEAKIAAEKAIADKAKLEAKVETLETKAGEVAVEKNWFENEEESSAVDEIQNTVKTEDKEGLLKKYESQAKEYQKLMSEPIIKAIVSAKEAGKDLNTFLEETKGVNSKKLTNEQAWEHELRSDGTLTAEQITEEMENFKALSPYAQKKQVEPVKAKIEAQRQESLKQYAFENTSATAQTQVVAQKLLTEKEQYLNSVKGKTVMGLEMTPARLKEQSDYIDNFKLQRDDGTVDVARIARLGMLEKNYKLMLQNAYTKGENDKAIKMLKEIARPSREDGAIKILPDTSSAAKKDVDAFRQELRG